MTVAELEAVEQQQTHPMFEHFAAAMERARVPAPVRAHFCWLAWTRYCARSSGRALQQLSSLRIDAILDRARP